MRAISMWCAVMTIALTGIGCSSGDSDTSGVDSGIDATNDTLSSGGGAGAPGGTGGGGDSNGGAAGNSNGGAGGNANGGGGGDSNGGVGGDSSGGGGDSSGGGGNASGGGGNANGGAGGNSNGGAGGNANGGAGGNSNGGAGPGCSGKPGPTGVVTGYINWDGKKRTYQFHVPASYKGTEPTAVVLNLHGLSCDGETQEKVAKMNDKSAAEGFIAVHPDGLNKSWNAGACCFPSATTNVDDVGFIGALLDRLSKDYCVDSSRVFATGMSNGGFLSNRLGCEMSDRIAAIAPVAGVTGVKDCKPSRPVPVLHIHGTEDTLVPYNGSTTLGFISVAESTKGWAERNGCKMTTTETFKKDDVTCVTYDGCKDGADVTLCTIQDGGHTWPGGDLIPSFVGKTTNTISATDTLWEFFKKHPLKP